MIALSAVLLLTLAGASSALAMSAGEGVAIHTATTERVDVRLLDLAAIRRLFHALARQSGAMTEGQRVAAWSDFSVVADAVLGGSPGAFTFEQFATAATSTQGPHALATRGVAARDTLAYQLLSVGYSARETADVVNGRISLHALDMAQRMIAVGEGHDAAANYLDSQYKLAAALALAPRTATRDTRAWSSSAFDGLIERYASLYQVEAAIIRAIIQTESAFNPAARSRAGAIGLMQLMPATARELGVSPFVPQQNIEGGVRYFSQLLRMFGRVDLALVAYNAGPGFAQRYARGQTALYGETREYVRDVMARLSHSR